MARVKRESRTTVRNICGNDMACRRSCCRILRWWRCSPRKPENSERAALSARLSSRGCRGLEPAKRPERQQSRETFEHVAWLGGFDRGQKKGADDDEGRQQRDGQGKPAGVF